MRKILTLVLLLTSWGCFAQKPDFIRTPNGYNTIVDWNLKAKTFILPSYLLTARPVTQNTLGTIFLNTNPADPHLYINNLSLGTYNPLAYLSDIPNTFTSNFQGNGTTASPRDLAINIAISGTMTAKGGMLTGDTASTAYNVYTSRRKIGSVGVTQVSGISQFGWASMASYIHLDTAHERILYVPYNRAYPIWSQDLGVTKHRVLVIDNCVGCVIDTSTFTLTIPSSGPVVNSIFGRNGNVTAQFGDYPTTLVPEGTNLYFTQARVLATPATGFSPAAGTISATDPLITVLNKLQGNITASVTGVSSFNTRGGAITLTTADVNATAPTVLGTVTAGSFPIANLSGSYPTFNQNTTGSAATLTTSRTINSVGFNGSANITITANTPGTHTNGYGLVGSPFSGANQTWVVDTSRGKLVTTYGLIDTINAHGATAGYAINPTLFTSGTVAVDTTQVGSKAWALSAFFTKNQILNTPLNFTTLHTYKDSTTSTTVTTLLALDNKFASTSTSDLLSPALRFRVNRFSGTDQTSDFLIYHESNGTSAVDNLIFGYSFNNVAPTKIFSLDRFGNFNLLPGGSTFTITNGNLNLGTAGNKIKIATGTNASLGTSTLTSGTVTVSTTAVTSSSIIYVVYNTPNGTLGVLAAPVGSIVNGTSFVINSYLTTHSVNTADTSTVNWVIIN